MTIPVPRRTAGRLLLLPLLLGAAACSTTVRVPELTPPSPALERLDRLGSRHIAAVVTTADTAIYFASVRLVPGAVSLRTFGDSLTVPLAALQHVEFSDPRRGALEGIGAGLLLAVAGGMIGSAFGDPDGAGPETVLHRALRVGAAVGVFAIPAGFVIGLGVGHRTRFVFPADRHP